MPPPEKAPFYDPIPPTYDEALATSSRAQYRTSIDDNDVTEVEAQSLLHRSNGASSSSRPGGYRPPTVETDDEDSSWGSDAESDEADQVRREMQEMDIEEPGQSRGLPWRKRIPFSLSLPSWKWSWRPKLPRFQIRLPSGPSGTTEQQESTTEDEGNTDTPAPRRRWCVPPSATTRVMLLLTLARIIALLVIVGFVYLIFASSFFGGFTKRISGMRFNPEDVRIHVQRSVDPGRMQACVKHFASYAHIAGTEGDYATAMDVESMFHRAGLDEVAIDEYHVYINYPTKDGRAVQIMDHANGKAIWSAKLEEEDSGLETSGHLTFAFHGHSKSGTVQGPLIYANYGSRDDFKKLKDSGIDTTGAIALVRYYGTQTDRALKIKAAEMAGFIGCIIYSDPADDGFVKGTPAPEGRFMPADGVQRGAVSLMNMVVGDVLTPGWESKKNTPRMKLEEAPGLPKIPSLPLAWRDAQVLLQHLEGFGQEVPNNWKGGVPDVNKWWTGNLSSPIVRLKNEQDEIQKQPIWNVYGRIIGMEQEAKSIIIGNHRDAWALGATDPHTGTAILIETARIFGELVTRGWRPLRTIEFMSWDAEEYNLIGSTEYVENNLENLRENAYAYVNLDTAISGTDLKVAGSPVFRSLLRRSMNRISDPVRSLTLKDIWDQRGGEMDGLGAGSDYVAFQDIAGVSSLDLSFEGGDYPYHSNYDTFDLVNNIIDPGFAYHSVLCQLVGLILLELADHSVLPFDMPAYGNKLVQWTEELEKFALDHGATGKDHEEVSFKELRTAAGSVLDKAKAFEKWQDEWQAAIVSSGGFEPTAYGEKRLIYNQKMAQFETTLLDLEFGGGIPNRTQFKHVVFGPQLWSSYDEAYFPAIRDTVEAHDFDLARTLVNKTTAILNAAASILTV